MKKTHFDTVVDFSAAIFVRAQMANLKLFFSFGFTIIWKEYNQFLKNRATPTLVAILTSFNPLLLKTIQCVSLWIPPILFNYPAIQATEVKVFNLKTLPLLLFLNFRITKQNW